MPAVLSKNGENRKLVADQDFVTCFWNDFEIVLNYQHSLLEKLIIVFRYYLEPKGNHHPFINLLENFKNNLELRSEKLKVKSFEIEVEYQNQSLSIVPFLDPTVIEKVSIMVARGKPKELIEDDILLESKQWINARNSGIFHYHGVIPTVLDVSRGKWNTNKISVNDILKLKNEFMKTPTFQRFEIYYKEIEGRDSLMKQMGRIIGYPYIEAEQPTWFFKFSQSQDVLSMRDAYSKEPLILFNRIKFAEVPEIAIVH